MNLLYKVISDLVEYSSSSNSKFIINSVYLAIPKPYNIFIYGSNSIK